MGNINTYLAIGAFVVAVVVAIVFIVLYTTTRAELIEPSQCPNFDLFEQDGLSVLPNRNVGDPASDCSGSTSCTFNVTNLGGAKSKCDSLGAKCISFSLRPNPVGADFIMQTSSTNAPSNNVVNGTNFYKPFA